MIVCTLFYYSEISYYNAAYMPKEDQGTESTDVGTDVEMKA